MKCTKQERYFSASRFKNATIVDTLSSFLLETDSPYCAPHTDEFPNKPHNIPIAALKISEIFETDISEIARVTVKNTRKLFNF